MTNTLLYQYPIIPAPIAIIPVIAVKTTQINLGIVVSIINSSGDSTNIYGMIKAAMANFAELTPVLIGSPPDTPAAANAASATGGVISAMIPK